jgi:hypothetical protein
LGKGERRKEKGERRKEKVGKLSITNYQLSIIHGERRLCYLFRKTFSTLTPSSANKRSSSVCEANVSR